MKETIVYILALACIHGMIDALKNGTPQGRYLEHRIATWKTTWPKGIALAFLIVLGPMVLSILYMSYALGKLPQWPR